MSESLAPLLLLFGAAGIGFAPIFVRLSEVGPITTAFYRMLLALPLLWLLERRTQSARRANPAGGRDASPSAFWPWAMAGFFFAGDMAFWNWSLYLTTVANSTLLTNVAPLFVTLGAWFIFGERPSVSLALGMATAFAGVILLVGDSLRLSWSQAGGDLLALVAAVFYASYLLSIKWLRQRYSTASILLRSGVASCVFLGGAALATGESWLPETGRGWLTLCGLAWFSHVGGQGLIAFSLAHLRAGFSSLSLLLQPVVAAGLAWWLLGEELAGWRLAGGLIVLAGIGIASRNRR